MSEDEKPKQFPVSISGVLMLVDIEQLRSMVINERIGLSKKDIENIRKADLKELKGYFVDLQYYDEHPSYGKVVKQKLPKRALLKLTDTEAVLVMDDCEVSAKKYKDKIQDIRLSPDEMTIEELLNNMIKEFGWESVRHIRDETAKAKEE